MFWPNENDTSPSTSVPPQMKTLCIVASLTLFLPACADEKKPYQVPVPQTRAAPPVQGTHPGPVPESGPQNGANVGENMTKH